MKIVTAHRLSPAPVIAALALAALLVGMPAESRAETRIIISTGASLHHDRHRGHRARPHHRHRLHHGHTRHGRHHDRGHAWKLRVHGFHDGVRPGRGQAGFGPGKHRARAVHRGVARHSRGHRPACRTVTTTYYEYGRRTTVTRSTCR